MKQRCALFFLATLFLCALAGSSSISAAPVLKLVGTSTKICQLIGDADWATGAPTAAKTETNFGLHAVDLGFPVDAAPGPLFFLFGDARPESIPLNSIATAPPDDAIGLTTRTAPPDAATCLDLKIVESTPHVFAHPIVLPTIQQGGFNVPSGGVAIGGVIFAFFWTDHCLFPTLLVPDPIAPLRRPPPSATCPEIPENSSIGRSVLATASTAAPADFHWSPPEGNVLFRNMPSGFVYTSAAAPPPPQTQIPVFGVARYRASIPFVALAPRGTFDNPDTWSFFAGRSGSAPLFVSRAEWESGRDAAGAWTPPPGAEIFQPVPGSERCVGEHSLTWNEPLHAWLLLYACTPLTVEARTAPEPWGPWSPPIVLLSSIQTPVVICKLVQATAGCGGLPNYQPLLNGLTWPGAFYAPFVMNRFTQDATAGPGQPKRATIYWLLSTWNPYVVVVMQSTLELN